MRHILPLLAVALGAGLELPVFSQQVQSLPTVERTCAYIVVVPAKKADGAIFLKRGANPDPGMVLFSSPVPICRNSPRGAAPDDPQAAYKPGNALKEIPLAVSPTPRALTSPGLSPEAAQLLKAVNLCDPLPCLGEAPRLVRADGAWTIRFPSTYRKPAAEARDARGKEPAPPQATGGQGPTRK